MGGADPAQADPEARAAYMSLFAPPARDEADDPEAKTAAVLLLPPITSSALPDSST
jgi:hypothetical protein